MVETDINQKVATLLYEAWTETKGYWKESAVENKSYKDYRASIEAILGEDAYKKSSDEIVSFACEAEEAGFQQGFRYGVMFMSGILKGQVEGGKSNGKN